MSVGTLAQPAADSIIRHARYFIAGLLGLGVGDRVRLGLLGGCSLAFLLSCFRPRSTPHRNAPTIPTTATAMLMMLSIRDGTPRHFDIWDVDDFEKPRQDKSIRNIGPKIRWKYAQNPIVGHRLWRSFRISVTAEMYCVLINKHRSQGGDDEGTASP